MELEGSLFCSQFTVQSGSPLTAYFFKIHFNIILSSTPKSSSCPNFIEVNGREKACHVRLRPTLQKSNSNYTCDHGRPPSRSPFDRPVQY
jgi:hypothetical protein